MSREMVCLQSGVDKPEACSRKEKVKHVPEVRDCGYLISHIAENLFFLSFSVTCLLFRVLSQRVGANIFAGVDADAGLEVPALFSTGSLAVGFLDVESSFLVLGLLLDSSSS